MYFVKQMNYKKCNERLDSSVRLERIMENLGQYRRDEIKNKIDFVIQKSMFESDKERWDIILEVQSRLYEEFEING